MAWLIGSHSCYRLQSRYALYQFIGSGRSLCSVVFRFGRKTAFYLDSEYFVTTSGSGSQSSLISALLQISKRMIIQFRNLPRTQIPIGMSAPSKAFSSPSARGIQMTENILILPSVYTIQKHAATRKIWLLSFAARDTQKVSRANSSMMSNDFGRTL